MVQSKHDGDDGGGGVDAWRDEMPRTLPRDFTIVWTHVSAFHIHQFGRSSIGYKNVSLKYSVVRSNWLQEGHQNNACLPTSRWKPTLHQPSSTTVSRLAEFSHTLSLIQQPGRCFTLLHIRIWRTCRIWLAFNVTFKVRTLTDMDRS